MVASENEISYNILYHTFCIIQNVVYIWGMKKLSNPFLSAGYNGPDYFCDRIEETQQMANFIQNGTHIALFAVRRIGKTGLIHHVFNQYKDNSDIVCIYIDILSTQNLADFTNQIATEVYNYFPKKKHFGRKITDIFQLFRPVISFDELTGTPSLSLTMETKAQKENTIGQILSFLDSQNIKIVFAIDEFQQVLSYPEKNVESLLRTSIQTLKNTSFIFCGSNQKMMNEIFNSAKRPFFASCTNINLDFIDAEIYKQFILQKFASCKKEITPDCLDFICDWTGLHTFYTQYFCSQLFFKNHTHNTLAIAHETAHEILKLNENVYFQYKNLLTQAQWNLLCAIAKEEKVFQPQSKNFISKNNLGTPAAVKRSLDALLEKEMIYYQTGIDEPFYQVYDKFLMRWLKIKF